MKIDLNDEQQFTLDSVRALLASQDDTADVQLCVSENGIAYLDTLVGAERTDGVLFRVPTWNAGEGYVGKRAAADDDWVRKIFNTLKRNWEHPGAVLEAPKRNSEDQPPGPRPRRGSPVGAQVIPFVRKLSPPTEPAKPSSRALLRGMLRMCVLRLVEDYLEEFPSPRPGARGPRESEADRRAAAAEHMTDYVVGRIGLDHPGCAVEVRQIIDHYQAVHHLPSDLGD